MIYMKNHKDGSWCMLNADLCQYSSSAVMRDVMSKALLLLNSTEYDINDVQCRRLLGNRMQAYLNERCVVGLMKQANAVCDASNNPPKVVNRNQIVLTVDIERLDGRLHMLSFSNQPFDYTL